MNNTIHYISVIGIGRYRKIYIGNLSVSADKKIGFISSYRYRPIWKKAYRLYTDSWLSFRIQDSYIVYKVKSEYCESHKSYGHGNDAFGFDIVVFI